MLELVCRAINKEILLSKRNVGQPWKGFLRAGTALAVWPLLVVLVTEARQRATDTGTGASQPFKDAFRDVLPIATSIAVYGAVFGGLARQAGLSVLHVFVMSLLVFSGSAQFLALSLIQSGSGVLELFLTTFLLGSRHLIMGLSLAPHLRNTRLAYRCLLAHGLNDESFALTTGYSARSGFSPAYVLGTGIATFLIWTGSTSMGALFGNIVEDPRRWGLDFAFSAVFIALVVQQVRSHTGLIATIAAILTALMTEPLLGSGVSVLAGALMAAVIGGVMEDES